jgi:ketosteroid isomerase-like protein
VPCARPVRRTIVPAARVRCKDPLRTTGEMLMTDETSLTRPPAGLTGRVRDALESGDLKAIGDLLAPDARWGALGGPHDSDCRNRDQILAWWGRARAAGVRAVVTELTAGPGTLLVELDVIRPSEAGQDATGKRWQVLTVRGDLITDIRGYDDRATAADRAGLPA